MAKSRHLTGGSSLALALTLGLWGGTAVAQPAPAEEAGGDEEVVITGSFIRGTPEDAAIPVKAVTLQELQNMGTPSTMDLVKTMTDSGAVRGEGDRRGAGSSVGVQTVNLRQLGSNRTLALLNGRRLQDQVSVGVRFNNVAVVPNNAVGRVETLRDGGAVTYGSDAVGGVVNFITRRDFDGVQARGNYRFIEDSDGDYDADLLWGHVGDAGNIMVAAQFQHRSTLMAVERDWSKRDYLQNNASLAWTAIGAPGAYSLQTNRDASGGLTGTITPNGAGVAGYNVANAGLGAGDYLRQMGSTGTFRDPGCRNELGVFPGWSATPSPVCYFSLNQTDKLSEESDTYTVFGEGNFDITPNLRYHVEGGYYLMQAPNVVSTPSEAIASLPVRQVTCTGVGAPSASCLGNGQVLYVPQAAYWVDGHNPAVADLIDSLTSSSGNPTLSNAQRTSVINNGGMSLTAWRPFGVGGNPLTGYNEIQRNRLDSFRMTHELKGDLPSLFGSDLQWTAAATGVHSVYTIENRDIYVERLQAALNGFGGPNCNNIRADLGGSTCKWFNPFSSAIQRNVFTGQSNLAADGGTYDPALANDLGLVNWLHAPIKYERDFTTLQMDFLVDGDLPIELPGGPIAIAFGGQYRYHKDLFTLDDLSNQEAQNCTTGVNCLWTNGPLAGNRAGGVFGARLETKREYPAWAAFVQAQFPIFDTLTAEAAVRYERFLSDTSDIDNDVVAPQGSIKWDVTDWLSLRGVAGSTFANVTPPENNPPVTGLTNATVAFGVGSTGTQFTNVNTPNFLVSPETGFNYNVGAIFSKGPLEVKVDYYNIKIDNLARNLGIANVLAGLALQNASGTTPGAASSNLIDCSSPLITQAQAALGGSPFVSPGFACVQGSYNAGGGIAVDGTQFNELFATGSGTVLRYFGQPRNVNAGTFQTDGIDVQSTYRFDDVFGGTLQLNLDVTKVLNWDMGDYELNGITVSEAYDGVGSFNDAPGKADGATVFEYRANVGFNFSRGPHNLNWRTVYTSPITVDNSSSLLSWTSQATNGNVPNAATAGVVDGTQVACGNTLTPGSPGFTNGADGAIPGAGTGNWGTTESGRVGLCEGNTVSLTGGTTELPAVYNSDVTYTLKLPGDTTLTATVQNVFDRDPGFKRVADGYDSFLESPLGRTYRIGISKKF